MRVLAILSLAFGLLQAAVSQTNEHVAARDASLDHPEHEENVLQSRDSASDIFRALADPEKITTCAGCESVLLVLKGHALLGDGAFISVLTELCIVSGLNDADVCGGAIALEGPIIANALRKMIIGSKTSRLFCITFVGLCAFPEIDPYTPPFTSPKPATGRPEPSGETPIKIVHYSDIHVDHYYLPGSNTNCTKPICCRPYTAKDLPGQNDAPAGPYGSHNCDVPVSLEESMYAAIKETVPDAAFHLFTGDIVDHDIWSTTQLQNEFSITDAYARMGNSFRLTYGTIGNHEASPSNAFPSTAVGTHSQWVYDILSAAWRPDIGDTAATESKHFGAYSVKYPNGNLRVISLNTNLYYTENFWLYQKTMETDPSGQLAWLVEELDKAELAGERVYMLAHVSFGTHNTFHEGSNYLDQIVNRYSSTIAAMFFGHTHSDQFELSYTDYANRNFTNAIAMSYIAPSLTPTSGMPAFRVYTVDPVTFGVLDTETYIADMTDPAFQTTGPVWTKYYSAKEAYGPHVSPPLTDASAELTPAFWHNVTVAMEKNETLFQEYIARKGRGFRDDVCIDQCKADELCDLRAARSQDNCYQPQRGIHFAQRLENPILHRDECGISVTRATIGGLVVKKELLELLQVRLIENSAPTDL